MEKKNLPYRGSTENFVNASVTITGVYPNRKARREKEKIREKKIAKHMIPTGENIIIRSALNQKQAFSFKREDGSTMSLSFIPNRHKYESNGIVTNPVVAEVIVDNKQFPYIKKGDFIILHHNIIFNKAMEIETDDQEQWRLQAIPVDRWIMGSIVEGEVMPFPDNVVCERVLQEESGMFLMPEIIKEKPLADKCTVLRSGDENFEPGQTVVIKKWADYEVVFMWDGEEKRRVIVWKEDIEMIL